MKCIQSKQRRKKTLELKKNGTNVKQRAKHNNKMLLVFVRVFFALLLLFLFQLSRISNVISFDIGFCK